MSEQPRPAIGSIGWFDLTVPDAAALRDFYAEVVGWTVTEVPMGDHADYGMNEPGSGKTVAGICHARGPNAGLPPSWLIYITVDRLDERLARAVARGAEPIGALRHLGPMGRMVVLRDPAGAVFALFEPGAPASGEPTA
jgi:predicted enzyme related to lactoylglutathione lyase